jgi:small redox-active disulfide protein 2
MTTRIEVLGPGCAKCQLLAKNAEEAARALELDYTLSKVTDVQQIVARGVMMTPALAVNGVVLVAGHVLSADKIKPLLTSV